MKNLFLLFVILSLFTFASCDRGQSISQADHAGGMVFYQDLDGDGYGNTDVSVRAEMAPDLYVDQDGDCDDRNYRINPESLVDENSNGRVDFNCDGIYYLIPRESRGSMITKVGAADFRKSIAKLTEDNVEVLSSYDPDANQVRYEIYQFEDPGLRFIQDRGGFEVDDFRLIAIQILTLNDHGNIESSVNYANLWDLDLVTSSSSYEYNANGQITKLEKRGQGDLNSRVTLERNYHYERGQLKIMREYGDSQNLERVTSSELYEYHPNTSLTAIYSYGRGDIDGSQTEKRVFSYEDDRLIALRTYVNSQDWERLPEWDRLTASETYDYDIHGNLILAELWRENDWGQEFNAREHYTYDDEGHLIRFVNPGFADLATEAIRSEEYSYDPQGQQLSIVVHEGTLDAPIVYSSSFTYNDQGQMLTKLERGGDLHSEVNSSEEWEYDEQGNEVAYRRHAGGDLDSEVTFSQIHIYDFERNKVDRIFYNGDFAMEAVDVEVSRSLETIYDDDGNLSIQLFHERGDLNSPVTASQEWTYDEGGNMLTDRSHSLGDLDSRVTYSLEFSYDAQDNLLYTAAHFGDLDALVVFSIRNTYGPNGNLLTRRVYEEGDDNTAVTYSQEYSYDDQNHLLAYRRHDSGDLDSPVTDSKKYSYDDQGRQSAMTAHRGDLARPVEFSEEYRYDERGNQSAYLRYDRGHFMDVPMESSYEQSDFIGFSFPVNEKLLKMNWETRTLR